MHNYKLKEKKSLEILNFKESYSNSSGSKFKGYILFLVKVTLPNVGKERLTSKNTFYQFFDEKHWKELSEKKEKISVNR